MDMTSVNVSRRAVAVNIVTASIGLGIVSPTAAKDADPKPEDKRDGLTHAAEAIHQEILFKASRHAVYTSLTETRKFDQVTRLSDAVQLLADPNAAPTSITLGVGGSFVLFGGYVTGIQVELVPDERIVQAWREPSWKAGDYSIVRMVLEEQGADTKLIFDHRAFPAGNGTHLASGWYLHYWDPLAKFLKQNNS
jgi:activator of HSP90 ATPase